MYTYLANCEGKTKIGITSDPPQRLKALQSSNPFNVSYIHVEKNILSSYIENSLHKKYKSKNIHYEWFDLSFTDLLETSSMLEFLASINTNKAEKLIDCTLNVEFWNGKYKHKFVNKAIKKVDSLLSLSLEDDIMNELQEYKSRLIKIKIGEETHNPKIDHDSAISMLSSYCEQRYNGKKEMIHKYYEHVLSIGERNGSRKIYLNNSMCMEDLKITTHQANSCKNACVGAGVIELIGRGKGKKQFIYIK